MKLRDAMRKEFADMNKHQVWCKIKQGKIPKGRNCFKYIWVFKINRNGIFRAHLVACGYSQIPAADFLGSYSPVVHDVTFSIPIVVFMMFCPKAKIVDMETVFLYGNIEEEIFMECLPGMTDAEEDGDLALNKCI